MSEKNLDKLLRDALGDKKEIKIRDGLGIFKPSEALDVIRINVGSQSLSPEMLDRKDLEEVVDYITKKKEENPDENPFLPDFD